MERLTERYPNGVVGLRIPNDFVITEDQRETWELLFDALVEYEDITHPDGNEIISMERLREMVEADKDGRVVILPKPLTVTDMDMIRDIGRIVNNLEGMEAAAALAGKDGGNE